jgi:hypothetical protein
MIGKFAQFYFSKIDPDYSIKGSRDPLALQVLWQHQAKKLIPFLSTVSGNLRDFQILCLAYHFYGKEPDNSFVRFFLRFEQLMGYVRLLAGHGGFNGIESVKRKLNEGTKVSVSNTTEDEILSNQRAYGIWGKYNRPFQDIGFTKRSSFLDLFNEKINSIPERDSAINIVNKVKANVNGRTRFDISELEGMKALLNLSSKERKFYTEAILKVDEANPYQNELFQFVTNTTLPDELDLYPFLKSFSKSIPERNSHLKTILDETGFTERILCPVNRIFRYLQTKPLWEKAEILKSSYVNKCKQRVGYVFHGGTEECKIKNQFAQTLAKDNWSLVLDLVNRNKDVTEWRNGAPWITCKNDLLEVHHSEGGSQDPDFDPKKDFDNGYFLDTYLNLYRQMMEK